MRKITIITMAAILVFAFASCDNGTTSGVGGSGNEYAKRLTGVWQSVEHPQSHYEIRNDYLKWFGIENGVETLYQSGKIVYYDESKFLVDQDYSTVGHLQHPNTHTYSFDGELLKMANGVAPTYTYKRIKN